MKITARLQKEHKHILQAWHSYVKLRYSEKATTIWKNLPTFLNLLSNVKYNCEIFSLFRGLPRIPELYYSAQIVYAYTLKRFPLVLQSAKSTFFILCTLYKTDIWRYFQTWSNLLNSIHKILLNQKRKCKQTLTWSIMHDGRKRASFCLGTKLLKLILSIHFTTTSR